MSEETYVDQGSMMDDYFSSNADLVFQDSDDDFDPSESTEAPTNAETAKKKEPTDMPGQDDIEEVEQTEETEKKETTEDIKQPDPFSFTEMGEDGKEIFDPMSAMDFIQRKKEGKSEPEVGFQYEEKPPIQSEQEQAPQVDYEQSVKQVYLAGFDYLDAFLQDGYDYDDAVKLAKQAAQNDLNNYLQEKKISDMENRLRSEFEGKKELAQNISEIEKLRPVSTRNLHEMASEGGYKNIEHFQQALMTPGLGGDAIQYLFNRDNQGKTFKSTEEVAQAMQDWFIKFSADKTALRFLEEITRSRIAIRNLPKIVSEARKTKERVSETNARAKGITPASTINKHRTDTSSREPNLVNQYLGIDEV